MRLTMDIVLEMLSARGVERCSDCERSVPVTQVRILGHNTSDLYPQSLYVCSYSQLRGSSLMKGEGAVLLYLEEGEMEDKPLLPRGVHCFPIRSQTLTLYDIINELLEIFDRFQTWEQQMEEAVLLGKDFQALVDLSAPVFRNNFFLIWDASYNVVAHTQNVEIPNEKLRWIIERGFFPKEVTDDLAKMGYMKNALAYTTPTLFGTPNYMNIPFIIKTYSVAQRIHYTSAFYFSENAPSQGYVDLFKIFAASLEKYILRQVSSTHRQVSRVDQCVVDLIENWRKGPEYLRDRAVVLGLEEGMRYCLCLIDFHEYTREQALYLRMRMRSACNKVVASIYQENLLLIFHSGERTFLEKEALAERFQKILELLSVCGSTAAFSSTFSSCDGVHIAYWQACIAMRYGKKYRAGERVHYYRDHSIYHMLESYANSSHFPLNKMYFQRLSLLMDAKNYKNSNLYLMRTYLINERNISRTAKLLYMHRNSVIYRIAKIRDLLDVDLDDPDVRLRLFMSFKILELIDPDIAEAHISIDEKRDIEEFEE